ncbi:MAG: threonine ammonia-lyase [Thermoplasmatota archaeon]
MAVTLADIDRARANLRGVAHHTPFNPSASLSDATGADVGLKLENLQRTGSFKIRGAANKIMSLTPAERARGVVAASAGNHAQGVALGARLAGIAATIVMPVNAPLAKVEAVKSYGAKLVSFGANYNEAETRAYEIQKETGAAFVHAYNDLDVIAGQGTLGLEMLEDWPEVETLVVPVGGGGLLAGIATAVKAKRPDVRVIAAEPEGAAKLYESKRAGRLFELPALDTIADGLATRHLGTLTWDVLKEKIDASVIVSDDDIAAAILFLLERAKTLVEGAGAVGLAALLAKKFPYRPGEKIMVLLSGGNIDVSLLDHIIERGLTRTGRKLEFETTLPDKPGSLRDLLALLADLRANVEVIEHERDRLDVGIGQAGVRVKIDTRGPEHVAEVLATLKANGYRVR